MDVDQNVSVETGVRSLGEKTEELRSELAKAVVGQEDAVDALLFALFAGGHVLLEGVPGLAKTLLVRSLAQVIDGTYRRVQFTPDLMPSDITGTLVFDPKTAEFHMRKGPVFANVLLADEINRTPPKTQAALLEAMEEGQVTISGEHLPLPDPFLVAATQNPVEYEGTYPLPEAQLDRFLFKVVLAYPRESDEASVLENSLQRIGLSSAAAPQLEARITTGEVRAYRRLVAQITVSEPVLRYALRIVRSTREHPRVYLGASPRGGVMLVRAAQAVAATEGRTFVVPDDIQRIAGPVLGHRLLLHPESEIEGVDAAQVVDEILQQIEVPR